MGNYQKMRVWQQSKNFAVEIYKMTNSGRFSKDFRFRDQIRSAAVSVPSNIAEGDELKSNSQFIKHLYIAKGSNAELMTQLIIANDIGYINKEKAEQYVDRCDHIALMIYKLIQARSKFIDN